ncbi:hypothetical protein GF374_00480 [Candidatus Woesearchaeota archaeon]|nr:hypothetical protein [Candidatus Woesearchaeota archaeon]
MAKSEKENTKVKLRIDKLRKDIRELSSKLKKLGIEKEKTYKEKNNLEKELGSLIKKAKETRDEKTKIDTEIKTLKEQREKSNKELKAMFSKLSKIKQKLGLGKKNHKKSSAKIRKQIDAIEFSIQTEVLKFEREKKYMAHIKALKQELKDIEAEESKYKDLVDFKKEISKTKQNADAIHEKIQNIAQKSSDLFENLTKYSKKITDTKKRKNELQKKLKKIKSEINRLNQKLGESLKDWSKTSPAPVPVKDINIMDKFKKKKRLTTEDILMLQRKVSKK